MYANTMSRSKDLLKNITRWEAVISLVVLPFWFVIYLFTGQLAILYIDFIVLFNLISCCVTWFVVQKYFKVATLITITTHLITLFAATLVTGAAGGIVAMFLWVPVLVCILSLPISWLIGSTVVTLVVIVVAQLSQDYKLFTPIFDLAHEAPYLNAFCWLLTLLIVLTGLIIFVRRLNFVLELVKRESLKVEEQNRQLAIITNAAKAISQHASSLSNELTATMSQQASGATQQAQAVVEITSNMEEMSQSALQIADNAEIVVKAANNTLDIARSVMQESQHASEVTTIGTSAVEETTYNFDKLNSRIQTVGQSLLRLSQYSREISTVLDVLNGFSDETQLLSLNASIEAAGAGEMGQRFGVVAQEIKRLAESSRESNKEVRKILSTLQELIAQAVMAAEESRKETVMAAEKVKKTGVLMQEITGIVGRTGTEVARIVDFAEDTTTLIQTISLATRQQQSASTQIVTTMQQIKDVAQQSAGASKVVSTSVRELSELTNRLNTTLVT
jgi:methyl-accepting chemotaxis protein